MNESERNKLVTAGGQLAAEATTREVSEALTRAQVLHVILKGPSLSRWLFPRGAPHASVDVDLIVNPEHAVTAKAVLAELGFDPLLFDIIPGDRPSHSRHYWRRGGPIGVDLHTTVFGANAAIEVVWAAFHERSTVDEGLPVPDSPARLAHLALHAAQNGVDDARTLAYLNRALDDHGDSLWRASVDFADAIDAREMFALGLSLTPKGRSRLASLGLTKPLSVGAFLRASSAPNKARTLEWFISRRSVRERLRFILWKLFPPPTFMRAWSPLARRGLLGLGVSYPFRIIWLTARTPGALVHWIRAWRSSSRAVGSRTKRERRDE